MIAMVVRTIHPAVLLTDSFKRRPHNLAPEAEAEVFWASRVSMLAWYDYVKSPSMTRCRQCGYRICSGAPLGFQNGESFAEIHGVNFPVSFASTSTGYRH